MTADAIKSAGTEALAQRAFPAVMDAASDGVESAVRCYTKGDAEGMISHLDAVDAGVKLLRQWAAEL